MIILHEYGEKSHYLGAINAGMNNNEKIVFREFSTVRLIIKNIRSKRYSLALKAINDFFYLSFCFIFPFLLKNEVVVIGMAPLDFRVLFFNRLLKHANVVYHSSWMLWDGSKYPKEPRLFKRLVKYSWSRFLHERVSSFAVVTEAVKKQLVEYLNIPQEKIVVVYHSFDDSVFNDNLRSDKEQINVIFVGRLVIEKGIDDYLSIAKQNPRINFLIIGDGPEKEKIKSIINSEKNISFIGFVSDKNILSSYYKSSDFILLPSKRNLVWEELFGMVLIEAMACGCIPICTDHTGPKTILNNSALYKNIYDEINFVNNTIEALKNYSEHKEALDIDKDHAIQIASKYSKKQIAEKWIMAFNKMRMYK